MTQATQTLDRQRDPVREIQVAHKPKLWMPKQVLFTPAALNEPWGQQIYERVRALDLPITELTSNRITNLRGETERETYANAKNTLAVVTAPAGQLKLQPIPPSADWQFHLAQGCPAHCQYCYLAGSLSGVPVTKAYANLPAILENLRNYKDESKLTTFEVSCYTDPLGIEHLTGSLAECIRWFGANGGTADGEDAMRLRWVSKFNGVDGLLGLPHAGRTRCRFSLNAEEATGKMEGGTASVAGRLEAARRLAQHGYRIGLVVAPIMPTESWREDYTRLFEQIGQTLDFECDLTFELITHRFTPGSKETLLEWYPKTKLDLDEETRDMKRNKFGGTKFVYPRDLMKEMQSWFEDEIGARFPWAEILYWT